MSTLQGEQPRRGGAEQRLTKHPSFPRRCCCSADSNHPHSSDRLHTKRMKKKQTEVSVVQAAAVSVHETSRIVQPRVSGSCFRAAQCAVSCWACESLCALRVEPMCK